MPSFHNRRPVSSFSFHQVFSGTFLRVVEFSLQSAHEFIQFGGFLRIFSQGFQYVGQRVGFGFLRLLVESRRIFVCFVFKAGEGKTLFLDVRIRGGRKRLERRRLHLQECDQFQIGQQFSSGSDFQLAVERNAPLVVKLLKKLPHHTLVKFRPNGIPLQLFLELQKADRLLFVVRRT